MKVIIIGFTLLFVTLNGFSQRRLEYEDRSMENAVFGGEANEACVTISSSKTIIPLFYTNNIQKQPAKIDTIGANVNYHLVFDARPGRESRTINIHVDGYPPLSMQWFLTPKQQMNYYIFDRDSILDKCYNQLMREGMNLFTSGMYEEAMEKYEAIKGCPETGDETKVYAQIALIDSIQQWRMMADAAFARSDYANAILDCQKILEKNPKDEYNRNRLTEARQQQREDCAAIFRIAQNYFENKDYASAQLLYEKIVDKSCNESPLALEKLQIIHTKKQRPHALTYEYANNVPIGFSSGTYKDYASGAYFTLRFNSNLIELVRTENDTTLRPELNVSFGWTFKVVKQAPVWIFLGPGYTGITRYVPDDEGDLKLKFYHAVSPEVGLLGKIPLTKGLGVALRYTFQYRFALDKETIKDIGEIRHVFGVGFCF